MPAKSKSKQTKAKKPLDQLAKLICQEHERATEGLHNAVLHAVKCGEHLREAKSQMQHGAWGTWVQTIFLAKYKLAARTERKYRWFAKNQHLLPAKWHQTASFTWQDAEQIIRKKGGGDDDPPAKAKGKPNAAPADETPKPLPLPPRPTAKHLEAAAAVLGEKGIQADPAVLLSVLEDLDVDLGPLLKKLEAIADQQKKTELKTWLASHEDHSNEWKAVCEQFDVWPFQMAYAAFRATRNVIFAWPESHDKATRPGPEWSGVIGFDSNSCPIAHFFVRADFDAAEAARAGAKWLLEHGEAYEICYDPARIKEAHAASAAPALADAQPPVEPDPAYAAPDAPTAEPSPQTRRNRK